MAVLDVVALGVLVLAAARGLLIGMIREAFSIVALGGAIVALRLFTDPLAHWLRVEASVGWGDFSLRVASGILLVVTVVGAVVITGRLLRRGVRAAGLGWADRIGGGVLGTAEGLLVLALVLAGAVSTVGRDHELLARSRTLDLFDEARRVAEGSSSALDATLDEIDVAAPSTL